MTSPKLDKAERAENLRQAGLYLGPLLLALPMGGAVYSTACEGRTFALFDARSNALTPFLFIFILIAAWSVQALLTRLGLFLFAAVFGIALFAPFTGLGPNRWLVNGLLAASAILITLGGVRGAPRRKIVFALGAVAVLFVLGYGARYYANVLFEGHSALRSSPLC